MTGASRCGHVSIIGLPNAGKSTLLNALVGQKISIVSRKVQTTRERIRGIALHGHTQIIFVDTPGIFRPKKNLEHKIVAEAKEGLSDADRILHIVDASLNNALEKNKEIIALLPENMPCDLVLNKVDRLSKDMLLPFAASFNEAFPYQETFMISALKDKGTQDMLTRLSSVMPEGPWLFGEDDISDKSTRDLAAEITREKIYDQLHQELPYSVYVLPESWEVFKNGDIKVTQVIAVENDNQKRIVLGKGGSKIKEIGQQARRDIAALTGATVHLKLFVKVDSDWTRHITAETR